MLTTKYSLYMITTENKNHKWQIARAAASYLRYGQNQRAYKNGPVCTIMSAALQWLIAIITGNVW